MTTSETTGWKRWGLSPAACCGLAVLIATVGVTYYATARFLIRNWCNEPDYGHGFFVPLFSLYLLWHRREMIGSAPMKWSWWALPMFALSALIRWASVYFNLNGDHYSIFPMLVGVTLLLGGWRALRWAWPAILFLVFMIPLPGTLRVMLAQPLQRVATTASVYVIQTLGMPSIAEGNTIWLPPNHLDVEQACSGIAMLMLFFAICVGAVLILRMSLWEKCVIVASAMPIAVIANVFRVTVAGLLLELVSPGAEEIFHHYVAPIEMIVAILLLWGELKLIAFLLVEPSAAPVVLSDSPAAAREDAAEVMS